MEEIQIKDLKEAFDGLVEDLLRRNRTINFLLDVSGGFQDALRALGKYLSVIFFPLRNFDRCNLQTNNN